MTSRLTERERQSVETAIQLVRKAISHDERGTSAVALCHYCRGLEHLLPLLYSPRLTGRLRQTVRQKCRQYLDRAWQLRRLIRSRRVPTQDAADETGGNDEEWNAAGRDDVEANDVEDVEESDAEANDEGPDQRAGMREDAGAVGGGGNEGDALMAVAEGFSGGVERGAGQGGTDRAVMAKSVPTSDGPSDETTHTRAQGAEEHSDACALGAAVGTAQLTGIQKLPQAQLGLTHDKEARSAPGHRTAQTGHKDTETGHTGAETGHSSSETGQICIETGHTVAETGQICTETGRTVAETGHKGSETGQICTETGHRGAETGQSDIRTRHTGSETGQWDAQMQQSGSETEQRGTETGHTSSETGQSGIQTEQRNAETGHSGTETGHGDIETGKGVAETGQRGAEIGRNGKLTELRGAETGQRGAEIGRSGRLGELRGAESGQRGAEIGQNGTKAGQSGSETVQRDAEAEHTGKETRQNGSETGQRGKDPGQSGKETGQRGPEAGHRDSEKGQSDTETGRPGSETGQRGTETGPRDAKTGQRGAEKGQCGSAMGQCGSEIGQSGSKTGHGGAETGQRGAEAGQRGEETGSPSAEEGQCDVESLVDAVLHNVTCASTPASSGWVEAANVGLDELIMNLKEILLLPVLFPALFAPRYFRGRRLLLLYGHERDGLLPTLQHFMASCPNCTLLACSARALRALALDGAPSGDVLKGVWSRARGCAPCVLCVTDVELLGLGSQQLHGDHDTDVLNRLRSEFLVLLDSFAKLAELVTFVGVTSRPWLLDRSFRRRFDVRRFCPPPTPEERATVLVSSLDGVVDHELTPDDLRQVAALTAHLSRGDMATLAEEAQARVKQRVQEARHFRAVTAQAVAADADGVGGGVVRGGDTSQHGSDDNDDMDDGDCSHGLLQPTGRAAASTGRRVFTPCPATHRDAIAMTWQDIHPNQLQEPPLTLQDVKEALRDFSGGVTEEDRSRLASWHEDFGQY